MSLLNLENKRLLVVEDDDMSYLYLNQLLLLSKCTYLRVKNGIDAITQFRHTPDFDMILMDIQLPDMDGKQVTREIRAMNKRIPIIAQTASRSSLEMDLIIKAGCTAVIAKPFTMDDLFGIIERHMVS